MKRPNSSEELGRILHHDTQPYRELDSLGCPLPLYRTVVLLVQRETTGWTIKPLFDHDDSGQWAAIGSMLDACSIMIDSWQSTYPASTLEQYLQLVKVVQPC